MRNTIDFFKDMKGKRGVTKVPNILIHVPGDKKEVKGSLRFNYMVPVPDECIEKLVIKDVEDEKYRVLLNKEYQFCIDNAQRIQKRLIKYMRWLQQTVSRF